MVSTLKREKFLAYSREKFIFFPVPIDMSNYDRDIASLVYQFSDYPEIKSILCPHADQDYSARSAFLSSRLRDYIDADQLGTMHQNQLDLQVMLLNILLTHDELSAQSVEPFIQETARNFGLSKAELRKNLYNHPLKENFKCLNNWTISKLVDFVKTLPDRDDIPEWVENKKDMGNFIINVFDSEGHDTTGITPAMPISNFELWSGKEDKDRVSEFIIGLGRKKRDDNAHKVRATTGGLSVPQNTHAKTGNAVKDVFKEETRRPDRRKGGDNPKGGRVGYGKKAPRI